MNNYQYCASWIATEVGSNKQSAVLDYGCGAGQIVSILRGQDIHAYGCDVFYEAATYSDKEFTNLVDQGFIKRIVDGRIPFPNEHFDLLVNNQVMEHVEDLNPVIKEMARVLKPGGKVLSLFPDRSVWREGHCGIPFLHWFPKESKLRVAYAATLRSAGLGYHKKGKSVWKWSADFCRWLDKWVFYRSKRSIHKEYRQYFCSLEHVEDVWLQRRLGDMKWAVFWWPRSAQRLFANKFAGLVFVATKPKT